MPKPTDFAPVAPPPAESAIFSQPLALSLAGALGLLLALSLFAIAPLFYPGYFQAHSGFVPLWNIADIRANFGPGWTPPIAARFAALPGDGLLPYVVAALLPLPPVSAVKLIFGASWLLGGAGLLLWLRSWLGHAGALIAALAYVYLPFQIAAVYVRGAWAETLFWGLLPWALLAATYLVTSPRRALLPLAALFWLALGLTQLGLALWAALLAAILLLAVHRRESLLPLLAVLGGVGLAAAGYALLGHPFTAPINPADHLLYPNQLFSAAWGFGASRPGWNDGMSLQVGLAAAGLSLLAVTQWWPNPAHLRDRRLWFFLLAALALALLTTPLAAVVWRWPLLAYPWQLLGLAGLCLSVLAGALLWLEPQFARLPLLAGVILFILLSAYPALLPQFIKTDSIPPGPEAILGDNRLVLLDHHFEMQTSGYTVGLGQGETTIPLAAHGSLRPGEALVLAVRWQPLQIFGQDYKIFVHLVDAAGNVLAQFDGYPHEGAYPTSQWVPGEVIADSYPLAVPADAPAGPYRLFVGLYDEATLERLSVSGDDSGRVIFDVQ